MATIVARTAAAAPNGLAVDSGRPIAPICVNQAPTNTVTINPDLQSSTLQLPQILKSMQPAAEQLQQAQFELFESTVSNATPTINSLTGQLNNLRILMAQVFRIALSPSQLILARQIIETYVDASVQWLSLVGYIHPYAIKQFQQAQNLVKFSVPLILWNELNVGVPVALTEELGYHANTVDVSLTPEIIYSVLSNVAANAEVLRENGRANFEATRCVISRSIAEQYFIQEWTRGAPPAQISLPVSPSTSACLGLPIGELENLLRAQFSKQSEGTFRLRLMAGSLTADQVEPQPLAQALQTYNLTPPDVAVLIINPLLARQVNANLPDTVSKQLRSWMTSAASNAKRLAPYYAPLMSMTSSPEFTAILQNLMSNCQLDDYLSTQIELQGGTRQAADQDLLARLMLAEESLGLQISNFVQLNMSSLENLDENSMRTALKQMLIDKKYLDAKALIESLYTADMTSKDLPPKQIADSLSDNLYELASATVNTALMQKPVQEWFDGIVARAMKMKGHPAGLQIDEYYAASISVADQAAHWLDPKTPYNEIPFQPKIMSATQQGLLNQLTGYNNADFRVLAKQQTVDGLKDVWQVINARLTERERSLGACKPDRWLDAANWLHGFAYGLLGVASRAQLPFGDQCTIMRNNADLMGLNMRQPPKTLADIVPVLNSQMNAKEVSATMRQYKMFLIGHLLQSRRFLMERDSNDPTDKSAPYIFQEIARTNNVSLQLNLIQRALSFSDNKLQKLAKAYLPAQRLSDYNGLLLRSETLPQMLNSQPAVESDLIARQSALFRANGVERDIYNSGMHDIGIAFLLLLPGAFSSGQMGLRMAAVSNTLFAPIPIYTQSVMDAVIQGDRVHTDKTVNLAAVTEIYWSQGMAINGISSFMGDSGYANSVATILATIRASHRQMIMDAGVFGVTALGFGLAKVYSQAGEGKGLSWLWRSTAWRTKQLRNAVLSGNRDAIDSAENGIRTMAARDQMRIKSSLRMLDNPVNLRLSTLKNSLQAIRLSPTSTANQIYDAEIAYQKIVSVIGRRAEMMTGQDRALDVYARSLFGPSGTPQDLWDIHTEFARLSTQGGVP